MTLTLRFTPDSLVQLYVDIEMTDRHNTFYEKFTTRYQIGEIMAYLWQLPQVRGNGQLRWDAEIWGHGFASITCELSRPCLDKAVLRQDLLPHCWSSATPFVLTPAFWQLQALQRNTHSSPLSPLQHQASWRGVAKEHPYIYVRFINMMINDSQFLLQGSPGDAAQGEWITPRQCSPDGPLLCSEGGALAQNAGRALLRA